jgi:hypothetical protein
MVRVAGMTFNFSAVQLDRPPAVAADTAPHDADRSPVRSRRAKFVASVPNHLQHLQYR